MTVIEKMWDDLVEKFPELKGIPLHLKEKGMMAHYMPPYKDREWGIYIREDFLTSTENLGFLVWMLKETFEGTGIDIDPTFIAQFCLLHEAGHHDHAVQFMKENNTDGSGWLNSHASAFLDFQVEVEEAMSLGVIPMEYEDERYRHIPHEKIADEYAIRKLCDWFGIASVERIVPNC